MAAGRKNNERVHRLATTTPNKFIDISVSYNEGGMSYFSGHNNPRSYYIHVTPVEVEFRDGHEFRKQLLFHGRKAALEEAKRYSKKKFEELVERTRQECERRDPHIMRIVNVVLAEEELTLVQTEVLA